MRIVHSIAELSELRGPVMLAIGVFDGVHLGHKAVIARALLDARKQKGTAVAVTFDQHPARVLRPEIAPRLLTATKHKLDLLAGLGVEYALVIPFTSELAATLPEDFVHQLFNSCKPLREICVGHDWSFGRDRAGDLALLKRMGDEMGFDEIGVPAVRVDGEIVSSTQIRAAVEAGEFEKAARLLGRPYSILGTVVRGDGLGRQLGYPTANLSAHNEQFPPNGVYAVEALLGARAHGGMVNVGVRPTISTASGERVLELHLFDFEGDLYGKDVEVFFHRFLREEQKFGTLEELLGQITSDAEQARCLLTVRGC